MKRWTRIYQLFVYWLLPLTVADGNFAFGKKYWVCMWQYREWHGSLSLRRLVTFPIANFWAVTMKESTDLNSGIGELAIAALVDDRHERIYWLVGRAGLCVFSLVVVERGYWLAQWAGQMGRCNRSSRCPDKLLTFPGDEDSSNLNTNFSGATKGQTIYWLFPMWNIEAKNFRNISVGRWQLLKGSWSLEKLLTFCWKVLTFPGHIVHKQ